MFKSRIYIPGSPASSCRAGATSRSTTLLSKRSVKLRPTFTPAPSTSFSSPAARCSHWCPRRIRVSLEVNGRLGLKLHSAKTRGISYPCITRTRLQAQQTNRRGVAVQTCVAKQHSANGSVSASSSGSVSVAEVSVDTAPELLSGRIDGDATKDSEQRRSAKRVNGKVRKVSVVKEKLEATNQEPDVTPSSERRNSKKTNPRLAALQREWRTCLRRKDMNGLSVSMHKYLQFGGRPTAAEYKRIVQEMSLRGRSDLAYKLYNKLDPEGFVLNPAVFRLLITACAKADQFDEALLLFGTYKLAGHSPSPIVYTTLIANLARHARKNKHRSDGLRALALWSEMCSLRVTLDQAAVNAGVAAA
eukprot:CAMPEP_0118951608 /NCGR_PEP_ID=MMETSP1169-20130426/53414_1 /TAXON_ID=36882 /ORGANISM="Pyramimonas obovata, Strain CCMP722" /LENGTH=359 /DNA_ID=CAMNT_0006898691 /DNA_START=391 /DNA_END=1466 /DNA_ORIENTATION=+